MRRALAELPGLLAEENADVAETRRLAVKQNILVLVQET
jgi:hypothetical protein